MIFSFVTPKFIFNNMQETQAGGLTQSVKYLPCKHEEVSVTERIQSQRPGIVGHECNLDVWKMETSNSLGLIGQPL